MPEWVSGAEGHPGSGSVGNLISTAMKEDRKSKAGVEMGRRPRSRSRPLLPRGQTIGERTESGPSRVSARERPEGCIAKAVALTPRL